MRIRALLGLALLLGMAISTAGSAWRQAVSMEPDPEDEAADQEYYDRERFASVKPLLPSSGVIGYREDDPPRSPMWPLIRFTQYMVAPVVLSEDVAGPRVLVNGRPEAMPHLEFEGRPLTLLHDAGNGVRLFGPGGPVMLLMLLALAPPLVVGWLAARACWPRVGSPGWRAALLAALAVGLALGGGSWTWFVWVACADPSRPGFFVAELLFSTVVAAALVAAGRRRDVPAAGALSEPRPTRWTWAVYAAFGLVLLAALATLGLALAREPYGEIDAWQMWNLHARLLVRGGEQWREPFARMEAWSHPDYPLLVPATVARAWASAGEESTLVPRLVAFLFAAATVGLLTAGLAILRTPAQGCLAGLMLLATPPYLRYTAAQYADVPLSFYFLAGVLLFEAHDRLRPGGLRLIVLAGLVTGMAAWTKNEGQLFVVATLLARLGMAAGRRQVRPAARELAAFAAGLVPFLAVLAYFKLRVAATNDLVAGQEGGATLPRLLSSERLRVVVTEWAAVANKVLGRAALVLAAYGLLLGRARLPGGRGWHTSIVLAVMLAGYTLVYLTTPLLLALHVRLSADRLCLQLWPCALLLFFLNVAAPEEWLAPAPAAPPASGGAL